MLIYLILLNVINMVTSEISFEVRRDYYSEIVIQEVLEAKSDDYMINKFMNEFSAKHVPQPVDGKDQHSILERVTIKKEGTDYCSYFFQNNHMEWFNDNLERNYHKKHNQHNWYAYHKIYVPKTFDVDDCFELFIHKYGSYFVLSDKRYIEYNDRVNNFIKRFHLYKTIQNIDTSNYVPYYISFIFFVSSFGLVIYLYNNRSNQIRTLKKILKQLKERNEFPNNL